MQKDISCRITSVVLKYIEKEKGRKGVEEYVKKVGLSEEYLKDEHNWLSLNVYTKQFEYAVEILGDKDAPYKIGLFAADRENVGTVFVFVRGMANPYMAYRLIGETQKRFSRVTKAELLHLDSNKALVKSVVFDGHKATKHMCDYRKGIYASAPMAWGLPPALIKEIKCQADGADSCVYEISWINRSTGYMAKAGLAAGILFDIIAYNFIPSFQQLDAAVKPFFVLLIPLLAYLTGKAADLHNTIKTNLVINAEQNEEIDRSMKLLEAKYEELELLNRSLEQKVEERTEELNNSKEELETTLEMVLEEKLKIETIIHGIADGVMVTDKDHKIITINPAAKRMFGNSLPFDQKELIAILEQLSKGGRKAYFREINILNAAGEDTILKMTSSAIFHRNREPVGIVSVFHDITQLKMLDKMKSDFVSNVSHELRTPLSSIKGSVDNMLDGITGEVNEKQQQYLLRIRNNTDRLIRLINELLDLSRIESGRIRLKLSPVLLMDVVRDAAESLIPVAKEKEIEFIIPNEGVAYTVMVDKDKLSQILTNLLDNAIKFSKPNGKVEIHIEKYDADFIKVSVADNGEGIPEKDRERIFDRFYQVNSNSTVKAKGTGLGLPIVRSLVEIHGGRIWVNSKPGEGSKFSFTLPLYNKQQHELEEINE
ncbi:MAG: PAS domain-containing protein [Nitrospirae bacterium]|nr:PAS domain-containing protein [Nitrospirota bacterium]